VPSGLASTETLLGFRLNNSHQLSMAFRTSTLEDDYAADISVMHSTRC
jgi:hypothetical protein